MTKLAKLGARHNWSHPNTFRKTPPRYFVLSDSVRLPDPAPLLAHLPRGACIILRHNDPLALAILARQIVAPAHRLGLKVIIAGDIRLALRTGADGLHLSEHMARRGRPRVTFHKPEFIYTAAAHTRLALWRARRAGASAILLSPVFKTKSHPHARTLGVLRFAVLAKSSPVAVVALGGVTSDNAARLALGPASGLAAIGAWRD